MDADREMVNEAHLSAYRFVILAGTSKAASTSVYTYLATHPQICPAEKETRFFLDANYPLASKTRFEKNGPATYLSLFRSGPPENWRLEATPDYLYSPNTPNFIRQTLANVSLIFILREPISRLLSWYRFARRISVIPHDMTFDEYVGIQRHDSNRFADRGHPAFYALEQGRYSVYLRRYLELFGESRVYVRFYENLRHDARAFMVSICRWVCIDEAHFRDFRFDVVNKGSDAVLHSQLLHKAYVQSHERARYLVRHTPKLRLLLRRIRPRADAMYEKMNFSKRRQLTMSAATKEFLLSYYKEESTRLREMLGLDVPWPSNPANALAGVRINFSDERAR